MKGIFITLAMLLAISVNSNAQEHEQFAEDVAQFLKEDIVNRNISAEQWCAVVCTNIKERIVLLDVASGEDGDDINLEQSEAVRKAVRQLENNWRALIGPCQPYIEPATRPWACISPIGYDG